MPVLRFLVVALSLTLAQTACGRNIVATPTMPTKPTQMRPVTATLTYRPVLPSAASPTLTISLALAEPSQPALTIVPTTASPSAERTIWDTHIPEAISTLTANAAGPWLLYFQSRDSAFLSPLFLMEVYRGGVMHLASSNTMYGYLHPRPTYASTGEYLAFETAKDAEQRAVDKEIVIFQLSSRAMLARLPVVSADLLARLAAKQGGLPENYYMSDELTSIKASGETLWSPDGRYLAYTAATAGPTADVYVFDTQTLASKRLTDGPTQASLMAWSPDGQWIIHNAWIKGHSAGNMMATPLIQAIWAAKADGSEIRKLEDVTWTSEREDILAWVSPHEFVTVSWFGIGSIGAARYCVRVVDLQSNTRDIPLGYFVAEIAVDSVTHNMAFTPAMNDEDGFPGLYLFHSADGQAIKIDDREWHAITWNPVSGLFVAEYRQRGAERMVMFSADGVFSQAYPYETMFTPIISPDGQWLAFIGQNSYQQAGIRLYDQHGRWVRHILPDWITQDGQLYWMADSSGFIFVQNLPDPDSGFPSWPVPRAEIEYTLLDDKVTLLDSNLYINRQVFQLLGMIELRR